MQVRQMIQAILSLVIIVVIILISGFSKVQATQPQAHVSVGEIDHAYFYKNVTDFDLNVPQNIIQNSQLITNTILNDSNDLIVRTLSTDNEGLVLEITMPEVKVSPIVEGKQTFQRLSIPSGGHMADVGKPELPTFGQFIAVPYGAEVVIEVLEAETKVLEGYQVYPAQPARMDQDETQPFTMTRSFYAQDIMYPSQPVQIAKEGIVRGVRVNLLTFYPTQYNPATGELHVTSRLKVNINFENKSAKLVDNRLRSPYFEPILSRMLLNYDQLPQRFPRSPNASGYDYVIISHSDFVTAAHTLADWKNSIGISTYVTDTLTTEADIYDFLDDAYHNWDNPPSFALFLGDEDFIPTGIIASIATDLVYAQLEGTDTYPEIHTGRIPIDSYADAERVIDYIINYERDPIDDPVFWGNILGAGYFQDDTGDGTENRAYIQTVEEVRTFLTTTGYNVDRIYVTEPSITPTLFHDGSALPSDLLRANGFAWDGDAGDIMDAIEEGRFLVHHRDHASVQGWAEPSFSASNVISLSNGNKLPIVFSINCSSGSFQETGIVFAEEWFRNPSGGAVGVVAATDPSPTYANDMLLKGIYDAFWPEFLDESSAGSDDLNFEPPVTQLGAALNYGKFMVEVQGGSNDEVKSEFALFHYFGDPTMSMRMCTLDTTSIEGTVLLQENVPLEHIKVILQQGTSSIAETWTDENGYYIFENISPGYYNIQVTIQSSSNSGASTDFRVLYETDSYDDVAFYRLPGFTVCSPATKNIDFRAIWWEEKPGESLPSDDKGRLYNAAEVYFYAKEYFNQMQLFTDELVGQDVMFISYVGGCHWWSKDKCTHTSHPNKIYLQNNNSHNIDNGNDVNKGTLPYVVWHEYSHILMDKALAWPHHAGFDSDYYQKGRENSDTQDSWAEGFAIFMAIVTYQEITSQDSDQYPLFASEWGQTKPGWTGLETNYRIEKGKEGKFESGISKEALAVAALLLDLYDGEGDWDNDHLNLGMQDMWDVMSGEKPIDMYGVYHAFKNYGDDDFDGKLDEIFKEHGFECEDEVGCVGDYCVKTKWWGKCEETECRHYTPGVPGASLVLNVVGADAGSNLALIVDVNNQINPDASYSYQTSLDEPLTEVYLEPPPSYITGTFTLRVTDGSRTSGLLTLDIRRYWDAVNNSRNKHLHVTTYLGSFTFNLNDSTPISFDEAFPRTLALFESQAGYNGWHLSNPVSVTLTAVDARVGVAAIEYSLDGSDWITLARPLTATLDTFTATHNTLLRYRATDLLGNVEPVQERLILVDTELPVSQITLPPAPEGGDYVQDVTVALTATDAGPSGLAGVNYRVNGGAWELYDATQPPTITQNGSNIFEHYAFDVAGNVEPSQVVTITLDKTVHTIIPLDASQDNYWAATRAVMDAFLSGQQPLMATQAFSVTQWQGTLGLFTDYGAGTVIVPGEVKGDFSKQVLIGPLDAPVAQALYPQTPVIFDSASDDERASWEQLEIGIALEDTLNRPDWPRVDEYAIASDTITSDAVFIPAGVTPDVQHIFAESGAADALSTQVQAGRWVVCQGDGCLLAQQAGLVPTNTLNADDTLPAGDFALVPVAQNAVLSYNWPAEMKLARYNDTPRFNITGDLIRVADYADNGEAALVMRRIGQGGVILIGGHASADASTYGLLYHALFAAGAEQVGSQVSVEQQFLPGTPPDVIPGLEPEIPVLVRTTIHNYGANPAQGFQYTEFITSSFRLLTSPTATVGTLTTIPLTDVQGTLVLSTGTWIVWTADTLPPGEHEISYLVANVTTDTLKPGIVTISEADFSYTASDDLTRTVQLERSDAVVRALLPALIAHNLTDEPDNVYPLPATGIDLHIRHDVANKLETRANNTHLVITAPYLDIVRDAFDQNRFPTIQHFPWYTPIVVNDVETVLFVKNTFMAYPERDYLKPVGETREDWMYDLSDWDGKTWVEIQNPYSQTVTFPTQYQMYFQITEEGSILVPGKTLTFDLATLLAYDWREPAVRYQVHSQELFDRGISFSVEPITGTVVLEGNGGSVYTAIGQHPIPFREYFPDAAINNPIAPVPSEIAYTDLWGRAHTVTETVRSSFYDIIPYPKTGDEIDIKVASTYGMEGENGDLLPDVAAAQTITVTYMVKAESVNRSLGLEELIIQELLPRGLGYDIEFISWESSNGSFVMLDEYSLQYPAFELLSFQGALPENDPQTLLITARLRTYPDHVREGSFLIDGGIRYGAPVEVGGPGLYDTGMTHVRVEQGYAANPEVIKRVAEAQVSRHGGTAHELINISALADVQRYREEVYVDGSGAVDKAATARVGGSLGKDLYFATVEAGGDTFLVYEITNNAGEDWTNVVLDYVTPPGITLTPIFTDGLEPPPNVYDTPYLWATEIPDIARGVYYYRVYVDESVAPGVMYPIVFSLSGDNVPNAAEFPLPVARVGVGGEVKYILGQTREMQIVDTSPAYVTPIMAALATATQMQATENYSDTEEWADFFASLTTTVPFTYTVLPDGTRLITYTLPAEWQNLPQQQGADFIGEGTLLVQTAITATDPGYRVVNYGPQLGGVDSFGVPLTVTGNPGYTTVSGPALTGTYSILSTTSPFYGDVVIDPLPGEIVDAWVDIAIRNLGNRVALSPEISATVNLTGGVEILNVVPTPTNIISGVITWRLDSILPYGGSGDPELDIEHAQVQLRFTPLNTVTVLARLAQLENAPFYVPLLANSDARYTYAWRDQTFTVYSTLGDAYGLIVGSDPLSAPGALSAVWDAERRRVLLSWTAIPDARDYVVYRSTQPDRDFYQVGPVTNGINVENYIHDDPLAPIYYYVVRARDDNLLEGRHSPVTAVYTGHEFTIYLPIVLK